MSEPMSIHDKTERNAAYIFILIFAIMAMGIVLNGYLYYLNYERNFRAEMESELSSIAQLKVGELVMWREERLGDGAVLFKNKTFSALVRRFLEKPGDADAQRQLKAWMGKYTTAYRYSRAYLVDTQGKMRMSVPSAPASYVSSVTMNVTDILRSGQVGIEDFHRNTPDGPIHLAVLVPIFDDLDDRRPLGVLSLHIDPVAYLYPFISKWPTPSQTGETLLVRRDGGDALFLSNLRFHENAALNLRIPLTKTEVPAVRAALGQTGIFEGVDYRGAPVIAAVRAVPGSPWSLIARMNTAEVYAPARERLWATVTFVGVLFFGSGIAMGFIWRQKSARYRERNKMVEAIFEGEARLRERTVQLEFSEAVHRAVIMSSADAIVRINTADVILMANPAAHWMFGYAGTELVDKHLSLLLPGGGHEKVLVEGYAASLAEWDGQSGLPPIEAVAVTKSGKKLTVECTSSECLVNSELSFVIVMRDVTERKNAEKELLSIMEAQPDILYVINAKGALIKWNSALQEFCGLTREQMMGRPAAEFVCEEDRPTVYEGIKEVFEKGSASIEARFIRRDGALVTHLCNGAVWKNPGGDTLGFIGVGKDITERKKAEEALRESEQTFARFFTMLPISLGVVSKEGVITEFNARFTEAFGYTIDDMPTIKEYWERVYPDESYRRWVLDTWGKAVEKAAKEGTDIEPIEYKMTCKGGAERFVMIGGAILPNGDVLATFVDITEHKKRDEELELFRLLVEKSGDSIFMIDDDDGCRMIYVNEAAVKHYGATREEIMTWRIPDWDPNFTYEMLPQHVEDIKKLKNLTIESHHRVKGGSIVPVEITLNYLPYRGRICHFGYFRNITERKAAAEAIRESEARYRQLSEASFEGIVVAVDGKILDINRAFARMFGYAPDEMIGKTPLDLVQPESYAIVADHIGRGSEECYAAVGRKKDGTLFPMEIQGRGTLYHGQKARVTAIRDITERVKAEQAVRESEERLRATFDNATSGMALVSLEGKFARVNAALCQMYGYEEQELLGKSFQEITHPDDLNIGVEWLRKMSRGEAEKLQVEKRYLRKDGGVIWCSVVASVIKDAQGKPLHMFSHIIDVTERRRIEQELAESEKKYRSLFQEMVSGFSLNKVVFDEHGEPVDYITLEVNREFERMLGVSKESVIGKKAYETVPGLDRKWLGIFGKVALTGTPYTYVEYASNVGKWFEGAIFSPGKGLAAGTFIDVTERKKAEEALREAKEEAEEATVLKDKYVSLVSHDLKNPLGTMMGFLKLIHRDMEGKGDQQTVRLTDAALESAGQMQHLINEVLSISRIKSGVTQPKRKFFDGFLLGVKAAASFGPDAEHKGIALKNAIPKGTRLYTDDTLLGEVLNNLVSNAIKFCKAGDTVTMFVPDNEPATIAVKDTGAGIKEALIPKLFKYEEKTSTTGTAGERGTGLGLPLSRDIMATLDGSLDAESEQGKGSTFYARIPHVRPKILVVDDDRNDRMLLGGYLSGLGVTVLEAEDGRDAMRVIEESAPHLLVVDVIMPNMDGFELLEEVRKNPATSSTPFIMIAIQKDIEVNEKSLQMGADDFINKPISMEEFIPRVRRFIG